MPDTAPNPADHWNDVYTTKADDETSWHQGEPSISLELIATFAPPEARVIDIGGGTSRLAGRLADQRFAVTVLDVSEAAIERAKRDLGPAAAAITWIVADITQPPPLSRYDIWHDRAAFHFLTDPAKRQLYVDLARRSIVPGGFAIMGTFAANGPERCSGLAVQRYDPLALAQAFTPGFTLVHTAPHTHITPWGKPQGFTFAVLKRDAE